MPQPASGLLCLGCLPAKRSTSFSLFLQEPPDQRSACGQAQGSTWGQAQGSECDQHQGSACGQGPGSAWDQGQGSAAPSAWRGLLPSLPVGLSPQSRLCGSASRPRGFPPWVSTYLCPSCVRQSRPSALKPMFLRCEEPAQTVRRAPGAAACFFSLQHQWGALMGYSLS